MTGAGCTARGRCRRANPRKSASDRTISAVTASALSPLFPFSVELAAPLRSGVVVGAGDEQARRDHGGKDRRERTLSDLRRERTRVEAGGIRVYAR